MSASIKLAVLRLISRCGYTVQKSDDYQRMLDEHQRMLDEHRQRMLDEHQRMLIELQQLEAKLVEVVSAFTDARKGHEYALRELEQSRAEVFELLDENKRLKMRVAELANNEIVRADIKKQNL